LEGSDHGLILRYCPGICLEGLRKTTNNINQDNRFVVSCSLVSSYQRNGLHGVVTQTTTIDISILYNGRGTYRWLFPQVYSGRSVKLPTHLSLVLRLRICRVFNSSPPYDLVVVREGDLPQYHTVSFLYFNISKIKMKLVYCISTYVAWIYVLEKRFFICR
jgi:hypothetical protein